MKVVYFLTAVFACVGQQPIACILKPLFVCKPPYKPEKVTQFGIRRLRLKG